MNNGRWFWMVHGQRIQWIMTSLAHPISFERGHSSRIEGAAIGPRMGVAALVALSIWPTVHHPKLSTITLQRTVIDINRYILIN